MHYRHKGLLCAASIVALQVSALEAKTELEPVIVTASKTENSLKDISASAEIITADQIKQKGAVRLRDILKFSTGMFNTAPDKISIRGLSGRHTLILIDGKRLTGEVGGGLEIDRIDISDIDRIEIIKGSGSALYGTDALGGIINVITKKSDKFSTTITPQYGAFSGDGEQKSITLSSNIPINDKLTTKINGSIRDFDRLNDEAKNSIQKDGRVSTIGFGINYELTDQDELGFDADYMQDEGDDFTNNSMIKYNDDNERQNYSLFWDRQNDNYNSKLRLYTSLYDKQFEVSNTAKNKLMKFIKAERETSVVEAQVNFLISNAHLLTVGGEFRKESFEGNILNTGHNTNSGVYKGLPFQNSKIEIDYYAVFIQDQWQINEKLSLIGSLRYDDSDKFEDDFSPKVGLTYAILENADIGLRFKTNYSHGFKTPTPADLYMENVNHSKGVAVVGNPDATSEKSKTFDIALEGEYQNLFSKVSYFHTDVEDLIEQVFTGRVNPDTQYKIFSFENLSKATMDGVELETAYQINKDASISVNYTFLDAEGDIAYGPPPKKLFKTMQLENRPKHLANIKTHYIYRPWDMRINLWGEYVGKMLLNYERDAQQNITGKNEKSYTLFYASVTKKVMEDLEVYAGMDNIFDKTDDDIPLLGAFAYMGVKYKF